LQALESAAAVGFPRFARPARAADVDTPATAQPESDSVAEIETLGHRVDDPGHLQVHSFQDGRQPSLQCLVNLPQDERAHDRECDGGSRHGREHRATPLHRQHPDREKDRHRQRQRDCPPAWRQHADEVQQAG
jgi:hypothetical protein